MIRPSTDADITDEEFEKVLKPFVDNYDDFIENYIMPEVIAYYMANAYYRNAMYETSFIQEYNSAKEQLEQSAIAELKAYADSIGYKRSKRGVREMPNDLFRAIDDKVLFDDGIKETILDEMRTIRWE